MHDGIKVFLSSLACSNVDQVNLQVSEKAVFQAKLKWGTFEICDASFDDCFEKEWALVSEYFDLVKIGL